MQPCPEHHNIIKAVWGSKRRLATMASYTSGSGCCQGVIRPLDKPTKDEKQRWKLASYLTPFHHIPPNSLLDNTISTMSGAHLVVRHQPIHGIYGNQATTWKTVKAFFEHHTTARFFEVRYQGPPSCFLSSFRLLWGAFSHGARTANYYVVYLGNTPEKSPPIEDA